MMTISRSQSKTIQAALNEWRDRGAIPQDMAAALAADLQVVPFDWKSLAKYSFWIAIACIIIAVGSALADDAIVKFIQSLFNSSHWLKLLSATAVASALFVFGFKQRRFHPAKTFSNEAILFLGVLATAGAVFEFGEAIDTGSGHFSLLLLLSFVIYGAIGWIGRSPLVWIFSLAALGSWMGTETGYMSGWGAYYLGMNYPLRFVAFGALLTAFALVRRDWFLERVTLIMGLLYLFISLWLLSIFGNYGSMDSWYHSGHLELFHWSFLFAAVACAAIYHGLRTENGVTKGFGLTFLFINLYTRYFEYFWNGMHKAIFFALLAISFWYIGSRAEKIWRLGEPQ